MELRKRINAKQTAKGEYYFDGTVEATAEDIDNNSMAADLVCLILATRKDFIDAGFKIVE